MPKPIGALLIGLALLPGSAAGVPAPARPTCTSADYRSLDFWVGHWQVFNTADNVHYGSSRIEAIMNGCAIQETYDSPGAPGGPYHGTSYSGFDRKDGHWHQMYVDTNGSVTWYSGGPENGDMVLTAPGQNIALQRMIYRRQPDGSVRQIGTVSLDHVATWQAGYDYTYRRD